MTFTSPLAEALAPDLLERFLRYVRIDTQSARDRTQSPSTPGQLDLARLLLTELQALGLEDAFLDENGYVVATLPGDGPVIGLVAHVDTSPDAPGTGVEPIVHRDYDGSRIELPKGGTVIELPQAAGHDIVSSSGDTLLGADDKAGVAEIMAAVAHLVAHPELPRPNLRICFTPDEEIGEGATLFDVERFGAICAYTLDGSELGELQDETFTAAEVTLTIDGVDAHPGWANGKLVNAARLAGEVLAAAARPTSRPSAPRAARASSTRSRSTRARGHAVVRAIVRDFDDDQLAAHTALLTRTAEVVVAAHPGARLEVARARPVPEHAALHRRDARGRHRGRGARSRAEGIEPARTPIRGGTDGSRLSEMGLPTPNLFTGGHDYHSTREWASLQEMAAAAATVVRLAEVWTRRSSGALGGAPRPR